MGCPVLGHMLGLDSSPSALLSEAGWTQRSVSTAPLTEDSRVASQKHAQKGGWQAGVESAESGWH